MLGAIYILYMRQYKGLCFWQSRAGKHSAFCGVGPLQNQLNVEKRFDQQGHLILNRVLNRKIVYSVMRGAQFEQGVLCFFIL